MNGNEVQRIVLAVLDDIYQSVQSRVVVDIDGDQVESHDAGDVNDYVLDKIRELSDAGSSKLPSTIFPTHSVSLERSPNPVQYVDSWSTTWGEANVSRSGCVAGNIEPAPSIPSPDPPTQAPTHAMPRKDLEIAWHDAGFYRGICGAVLSISELKSYSLPFKAGYAHGLNQRDSYTLQRSTAIRGCREANK
ncbi:hypothetical protein [Kordiimonas sp.]|uniref:hypothetical protein n=1 Tax=Kordiimonas sp. TaxID=1970157 RepID=UPI003A8D5130